MPPKPERPETFQIPSGQSQLFLDDERIADKQNVTRRWHRLHKHPMNPLFTRSGIEQQIYLFGTVLREPEPGRDDEPVFRMWYYAAGSERQWIGYARSQDGLNWEKPELGRIQIDGSAANNAVFSPPGWRLIGLSGVIKDPNPDVPEEERYKMVLPGDAGDTGVETTQGKHFLMAVSADGFRWNLRQAFRPEAPCYPDRACFVWDPYHQVYTLYSRSRFNPPELVGRGGPNYFGRAIGRGTSCDFKTWSEEWPQVMQATPDDPGGTEIYGWSAFPCGGQWIALTQIHHSLPHLAYIDMSLSHSRNGLDWQRQQETVLPVGDVGEWDRFNQCTSNHPLRIGDEVWVYYSGRMYRHGEYRGYEEWRPDIARNDSGPNFVGIGLATLRVDGWCSLQASFDAGTVITRPVVLPEGELWVNIKSDWGKVVVEILDEEENPIAGMPPSRPVSADGVHLKVEWPDGVSLGGVAARPVRLRFTLENAHLFAWMVE